MTSLDKSIFSESERAIEHYEITLDEFEKATPEASASQALKVLLARDAVATTIEKKNQLFGSSLEKVLELDERLKKLGEAIASVGKLEEWRTSFNPAEIAWWWFFQPPKKVDRWDRYDGIFNGFSIVFLTAFVAYMTSIIPRFAVGGFTVLESFGIIGPSGLMAIALSSLQGGVGQEFIRNNLKKLKIPENLYSEVTFGLSGLLLITAILIQMNLPKIADRYYQQGNNYYKRGLLRKAEDSYKQALNLDPDNQNINIGLGEVYESLGEFKEAEKHYREAFESGIVKAFNNLGRVYRQNGDPTKAESLFRMGIQRVKNDDRVRSQLHRNLGWALFDQKQYDTAIPVLNKAIELEQKIGSTDVGSGMAYCILAETLEFKNEKEKAAQHWNNCRQKARPETIKEYQWLLDPGNRNVAPFVDTTSVVGEDDEASGQ
ncbi:tetratricopeptide repeat protein [Aerosakkonemataceae cyanobacterium BLCC-F154]|uniref:Tetratricopeptide repeat protein n=1 Tax=Floridaenema fluviatile BLCC-F154 TaxID=3153640 RepID=A0ABV4YJ41_9CYAN